MKKTMFFAAIAALSVAISCQKDEMQVRSEAKPITFTATIDVPSDTKVSVNMTSGKALWHEGDEITISDGTNTGVYTANSGGVSTDFTYSSGFEFTEAGTYTATYGTAPVAGVDQDIWDAFKVPEGQNLVGMNRKINPNAEPGKNVYMEASAVTTTSASESPHFTFKVKCGLLRLSLCAEDRRIMRICVSDGTNWFRLLCDPHQPSPLGWILMDITDTSDFYIALPAGTYTKYIIRDSAGYEAVKTAKSGKETQIEENHISRVTFGDLKFNAPIYPEGDTAGIKIGDIWWAPVNCGYEPATTGPEYKGYTYGKLYQWGRKYGQGYYKEATKTTPGYEDADYPGKPGSLSITDSLWTSSNGEEDSHTFYKGNAGGGTSTTAPYQYDWIQYGSDTYWNIDGEFQGSSVSKNTDFDPCPQGWRMPSEEELNALAANKSSWTSEHSQNGYWFSGSTTYSESEPRVFLPAAGSRDGIQGNAANRGFSGCYWSAAVSNNKAKALNFDSATASVSDIIRATGGSVRCVQE